MKVSPSHLPTEYPIHIGCASSGTRGSLRPSVGRIYIDVTIDDPKAYTKPWDVRLSWDLKPDWELIESICEENNRDVPHMIGK